jgi:two-component system nitrate/nitrite response regulator NarL
MRILATLTNRERDVIKYLTEGLSNHDISEKLGLKLATVKLHVSNTCRKIGAKNRTQAALIAQKSGIGVDIPKILEA